MFSHCSRVLYCPSFFLIPLHLLDGPMPALEGQRFRKYVVHRKLLRITLIHLVAMYFKGETSQFDLLEEGT